MKTHYTNKTIAPVYIKTTEGQTMKVQPGKSVTVKGKIKHKTFNMQHNRS